MEQQAPYEKLSEAIILQACKDYRDALRNGNFCRQREVERFFRSDWYLMLSQVDGEFIIELLKEEYLNERNQAVL
jgi:hypothetical protein